MDNNHQDNDNNLDFLEKENKMTLHVKDILFLILRNIHWLILFAAVGAVVANFYARRQTRMYESYAQIIIKNNAANTSNPLRDVSQNVLAARSSYYTNNIDNELRILTAQSTMYKVVKNLNLNVSYMAETKLVKRDRDLYGESPIEVSSIEGIGASTFISLIVAVSFFIGEEVSIITADN